MRLLVIITRRWSDWPGDGLTAIDWRNNLKVGSVVEQREGNELPILVSHSPFGINTYPVSQGRS